MEHNFEYRQKIRMARLEAKRKAAYRRRVCTLTVVFTFAFFFISIISANAVIAKAGEKDYEKMYTSIIVERGETVWEIAAEHMTPGYDAVQDLVEEIGFINGLDEAYSIKSGTLLMIPYFSES